MNHKKTDFVTFSHPGFLNAAKFLRNNKHTPPLSLPLCPVTKFFKTINKGINECEKNIS